MELLSRTCNTESANVERIIARMFVVLGGVFWVAMYFGASTNAEWERLVYTTADIEKALGSALIPLAVVIVVFVLGMFYERLTALVLLGLCAAVVVYGVLAGWESGVWLTAMVVLVGPMFTASILFWLAGRMQQICLLEQKVAR
jgi:hypothetical protein